MPFEDDGVPVLVMATTNSNHAFTGGHFFSQSPETCFIPEDFSSDERLMIETAEQFSRSEILPHLERIDAQEAGLMPSLVAKAGELGFCGIDTAEAYGGLGLPKNLAARILEFLSLNGSFSVTIGITSGISQVGLSLFGNESQRTKYLPLLTSGEQIGAYCLSEPNSGSDALSLSTKAVLQGDKYILNGTKMWISNAQWADQFLVMAKVDGERLTAFLVEKDFPGVTVAREEHKMGLKGSSTARVVLENAEVPAENLVYIEGKGHVVAFNALNLGRFKLSSMSIGPAREAMRQAASYAVDRKQFGMSLSQFGLIQQKLATMAAQFFASETMIYRTGALIDGAFEAAHAMDIAEWDQNRLAAEEFAVECSACKVISTEAEAYIVDEALQIYGGYGFTEEFPVARLYRDARISRIYEGTNEINRVFLADRLRRRAAEGKCGLNGNPDSFVSELAQKAMAMLGEQKLDQVTQGALSDLVMLTYADQSARIRANRLGGTFSELSKLYTNLANVRAAQAYQEVTGEAVSIPASSRVNYGELSDAVVRDQGPITRA